MEIDLDARASVAGGALAAVRQANEKERNSFNTQIESQREQLLSSNAWELRKVRLLLITKLFLASCLTTSTFQLLYTQQIMLTSAKLPGFEGPTVDSTSLLFQSQVCSVMHSAFYLRNRVGESSHVKMLNKQLESLKKNVPAAPKKESVEQPNFQAPFPVQQLPLQFQQPMMPQFNQQPIMYAGQTQQQPMMGVTPMGYQAMPVGYQPQIIPQQGQQAMQQQQFFGFQHGQPNKLS